MNLRQLQFFIAVIESRGISKAAKRMHVSQPAVSVALRTLEEELGHTLFDRKNGGRRSRPTARAMRFYQHALEILERCDLARRSLAADDGRPPKIRIGVLRTLSARDVANTHALLNRNAPQWRWSVREGTSGEISNWLQRGRVEIGWTVVDNDAPMARILWREPYVAMVSRQHRFARNSRLHIAVKDLAEEQLVLRGTCELRAEALQAAGLAIRPAARAERDELALHMVANGVGFAIAPRCLATAEVVALPVTDLGLSRAIGLKWTSDCPDAAIGAAREILSIAPDIGTLRR